MALKNSSLKPDCECIEPTSSPASSKVVPTGTVEAAFHQVPGAMSLIWAKIRYIDDLCLSTPLPQHFREPGDAGDAALDLGG